MGESSPPPRFRIKLEDGAELPVSSVEALARRVARGDVGPDTKLFDASTGGWLESAKAPVVRFILDELRREGADLPPEWKDHPPSDAPVQSPQESEDPLTLGFTPVPPPPEPHLEVEEPVAPQPTPRTGSGQAEGEWVTPLSEGGLFTPTSTPRPATPHGRASGAETETADVAPRRPLGSSAPSTWAAGILLGAIVMVVAARLLIGGGDSAESAPGSDAAQGVSASGVAGPAGLPVPDGLEQAVSQVAVAVTQRFLTAADSVRVAHGLNSAPPEPWLDGSYLADAGDFPEVRQFWEDYRAFLDDFSGLDRRLFLDVADHIEPSLVSSERQGALREYLERRYTATVPLRQDAYAQLASVTATAIDLHDFLVASASSLRYTPAVGMNSVPRDPVLEVGTEDPAVRRGLDSRLDALFSALDESRGGGAPSQVGLQDDLFRGFGTF